MKKEKIKKETFLLPKGTRIDIETMEQTGDIYLSLSYKSTSKGEKLINTISKYLSFKINKFLDRL